MRNLFITNLFLICIVVLLFFKLYDILSSPLKIPSNSLSDHKATTLQLTKNKKTSLFKSRPRDFRIISEKNLFHPDRMTHKEPDNVSVPVSYPVAIPILVGTLISDNRVKAFIKDPTTKITKPYSVDDSVLGYKVRDIRDNKVTLSHRTQEMELNLGEVKKIQSTKARDTHKRIYGTQLLKSRYQRLNNNPLPASKSRGK